MYEMTTTSIIGITVASTMMTMVTVRGGGAGTIAMTATSAMKIESIIGIMITTGGRSQKCAKRRGTAVLFARLRAPSREEEIV